MLKTRIIPTLLWKNFGLVKGTNFNSWRRVGSVVPALRVYNQRDVDELILLDISRNESQQDPDYDSVAAFSRDCFVPLTYGGGVTTVEQVQKLLSVGADKVCINTAAHANPQLISDVARLHGSQCVVVSIDVCWDETKQKWECFSHSGKKMTGRSAIDWAKEVQDRGAGEILVCSIDRDGTFQGYDLPLIQSIASNLSIPVIASGGAGSYQHMVSVVKQAGASAVAAASIFHFTELTPAGAKQALSDAGIPVRKNYTVPKQLDNSVL